MRTQPSIERLTSSLLQFPGVAVAGVGVDADEGDWSVRFLVEMSPDGEHSLSWLVFVADVKCAGLLQLTAHGQEDHPGFGAFTLQGRVAGTDVTAILLEFARETWRAQEHRN
jgi:hypothetical protein